MPKLGERVVVHKITHIESDVIVGVTQCGKVRLERNRDTLFEVRGTKGFPIRQATGVIYITKE